jgi:cytoskeletal protein RodZ
VSSADEVTADNPETLSREAILLEVGELLRSERNKKTISIDMVANALNFRKVYLEALEAGDWSNMPGEVYALGFLRQYAAYLHLDLDHTIEKLKSGHYQLTKPLTFPDPPVAPKKSWMIIAALAFILLFVGLNIFNHTPAPLPSQLMQDSAVNMQKSDKANDTPNTATPKNLTTDAVVKPEAVTNVTKGKEKQLQSTSKAKAKPKIEIPATQETSPYNYKFTAVTGDVWLQLHDRNEPPALIREVLLKKGESMRVISPKALKLTSGNSLALKIYLNKKLIVQVNQLGEKGKVLHSHLLQKKKSLP